MPGGHGGRPTVFAGASGRRLAFGAWLLAVAVLGNADTAIAEQGFVVSGGGGSSETMHVYQGVIYAPASSLSETGPVFRSWVKGYRFYYVTDLPGQPDARVEALGLALDAEAGWQVGGPWGRVASFGGVSWRTHELSPEDPGSALAGERLGLTATLEGEVYLGERWGIMGHGNYVTTFGQYWLQGRPFIVIGDATKVGLNSAVWGGPDYTYVRTGLFIQGFELPLGPAGRIFLGAEAGASLGLHDESLSPFAGLTVGFLF